MRRDITIASHGLRPARDLRTRRHTGLKTGCCNGYHAFDAVVPTGIPVSLF